MLNANPTVSVCLIVKNEEANIARCLDSLAWADEVIIVDTGSTDNTKSVIEKHSVKVKYYTTEWEDSFSKARNFSMDKATKDYILWLDADEEVIDGKEIKRFVRYNNGKAIYLPLLFPDAYDEQAVMQLRIVPNLPDVRFSGRVHEQLSFDVDKAKLEEAYFTDTKILHYGYTSDTIFEKLQRNLYLLKKDIKENPNNSFIWANMAKTYTQLGMNEEALEVIEKAISITNVVKVKQYFESLRYQLLERDVADKKVSIVLVDTKDTDDDCYYLTDYEVIKTSSDVGSINKAIELCSGNYIVIIADSFIPSKNWDIELLDVFDTTEKVGMVGPVSNGLMYSQRINGEVDINNIEEVAERLRVKYKDTCAITDYLDGSFVVLSKKMIDEVGLFNEDYEYMGGATADYCKKVIDKGYLLCICADVFVFNKQMGVNK